MITLPEAKTGPYWDAFTASDIGDAPIELSTKAKDQSVVVTPASVLWVAGALVIATVAAKFVVPWAMKKYGTKMAKPRDTSGTKKSRKSRKAKSPDSGGKKEKS